MDWLPASIGIGVAAVIAAFGWGCYLEQCGKAKMWAAGWRPDAEEATSDGSCT